MKRQTARQLVRMLADIKRCSHDRSLRDAAARAQASSDTTPTVTAEAPLPRHENRQ